jgi:hypothetical protein
LFKISWGWFPDRPGLASGLILSGFGFSAIIFNNIALAIVNPENLQAVDGVFPASVTDRVPFLLQILSAVLFALTITAVILIFPAPEQQEDPLETEASPIIDSKTLNQTSDTTLVSRDTLISSEILKPNFSEAE